MTTLRVRPTRRRNHSAASPVTHSVTTPDGNARRASRQAVDDLLAEWAPVLAAVAEGALQRELDGALPTEAVGLLKSEGFGALRVPAAYGGSGLDLVGLTRLQNRTRNFSHANAPRVRDDAQVLARVGEIAAAVYAAEAATLRATSDIFDALGASATARPLALDRHWRNARTVASHNPRILKARIVGAHAVNGTPPPYAWSIGGTRRRQEWTSSDRRS